MIISGKLFRKVQRIILDSVCVLTTTFSEGHLLSHMTPSCDNRGLLRINK